MFSSTPVSRVYYTYVLVSVGNLVLVFCRSKTPEDMSVFQKRSAMLAKNSVCATMTPSQPRASVRQVWAPLVMALASVSIIPIALLRFIKKMRKIREVKQKPVNPQNICYSQFSVFPFCHTLYLLILT